jgi:hypothetical protein
MKVVATVALANFPLWKMVLEKTRSQVDELYVRVDMTKENKLEELLDSKLATAVLKSDVAWDRWSWREEMIRMVDGVGADIVLTPDQDEVFDDSLPGELARFWASGKDMIFFNFCNPTNDNRVIPELNGKAYPSTPHCMGYRWRPDITYHPYAGLCMPTNFANIPDNRFMAHGLVKHYCMWTRELEEEKKAWVKREYGIF